LLCERAALNNLSPLVIAPATLNPAVIPKSTQSTFPSFSIKLNIKSNNVSNPNSIAVPNPGTNPSINFPKKVMEIDIAVCNINLTHFHHTVFFNEYSLNFSLWSAFTIS